jgi:hypothetical protein
VAGILWSLPHLRRIRQVRRFRSELDQVDLVTLAWRETLHDRRPNDDIPSPIPDSWRSRREQRRRERDSGGETLV